MGLGANCGSQNAKTFTDGPKYFRRSKFTVRTVLSGPHSGFRTIITEDTGIFDDLAFWLGHICTRTRTNTNQNGTEAGAPMLRAEVHAHELRASQNLNEISV